MSDLREKIARQFCYATNIFDSPAEIAANMQHPKVIDAYKRADFIMDLINIEMERVATKLAALDGDTPNG